MADTITDLTKDKANKDSKDGNKSTLTEAQVNNVDENGPDDDGWITEGDTARRLYDDDFNTYLDADSDGLYSSGYIPSTGGSGWAFTSDNNDTSSKTGGKVAGPSAAAAAGVNPTDPIFGGDKDSTATNFLSKNMGSTDLKIFGAPMKFGGLDDPKGRIYQETFFDDMPVVFVNVGVPKINIRLFGSSSDKGKTISFGDIAKKMIDSGFVMWNVFNNPGNRFINFKPAWNEYYDVVKTMAGALYEDMGLGQTNGAGSAKFTFGKVNQDATQTKFGVPFYLTYSGTNISESGSNSYGESQIASETNQAQAQIREDKMLAGSSAVADIGTMVRSVIDPIVQNTPVLGGVIGAFAQALDGAQMVYPNMWMDSSFMRSYNLEMEFYSPYGDKESIYRYVYLPFIMALAFSLPRQDGFYGYKQPFILRVTMPGMAEVEVGVIDNITINRGDQGYYTVDGLARLIKVNLSLVDLYPQMVLSRVPRRLKYNPSLTSYITTLSGIRSDQRKAIVGPELKNRINEKTYLDPTYKPDSNARWFLGEQAKTGLSDPSHLNPWNPYTNQPRSR